MSPPSIAAYHTERIRPARRRSPLRWPYPGLNGRRRRDMLRHAVDERRERLDLAARPEAHPLVVAATAEDDRILCRDHAGGGWRPSRRPSRRRSDPGPRQPRRGTTTSYTRAGRVARRSKAADRTCRRLRLDERRARAALSRLGGRGRRRRAIRERTRLGHLASAAHRQERLKRMPRHEVKLRGRYRGHRLGRGGLLERTTERVDRYGVELGAGAALDLGESASSSSPTAYERSEVMASKASQTKMMRDASGMSSPVRPSG